MKEETLSELRYLVRSWRAQAASVQQVVEEPDKNGYRSDKVEARRRMSVVVWRDCADQLEKIIAAPQKEASS